MLRGQGSFSEDPCRSGIQETGAVAVELSGRRRIKLALPAGSIRPLGRQGRTSVCLQVLDQVDQDPRPKRESSWNGSGSGNKGQPPHPTDKVPPGFFA